MELFVALDLRGGRGRGRSTYHYHFHSEDDGKSAFGVSEVAMPKRSFQRGVVRGDGG